MEHRDNAPEESAADTAGCTPEAHAWVQIANGIWACDCGAIS